MPFHQTIDMLRYECRARENRDISIFLNELRSSPVNHATYLIDNMTGQVAALLRRALYFNNRLSMINLLVSFCEVAARKASISDMRFTNVRKRIFIIRKMAE